MAEFGPQATELSQPQAAGATPVAPVREQFVDTSIMPVVADIGNIFVKGIVGARKQQAEDAKNSVVQSYVQRQQAINNAVVSGQLKPDQAATRSRALFGEYAAGYAPYIEDLSKARIALSGGSELGAIEKTVAAAEDIQKNRITRAQARGVTIYSWMDKDTLEQALYTSELSERNEKELDRMLKMNAERRAQSAEERTIFDRDLRQRASSMVTEIAGANLDRITGFLRNVSANLGSQKMGYEEAALAVNQEFAQIEAALQAAAGVNPELAGPYRSLFTDLKTLGQKIVDPKTRNEVTEEQFKAIISQGKLLAVTSDPKLKAVVVASELLKGQAIVALTGASPITDYIARMTKAGADSTDYVPPVVGNPDVEKDVLNFLEKSVKKVNEKGFTDNAKAEVEVTNSINQVLKQTGDALKTGSLDAPKMIDLAKFFASPEYGKFAASRKLNSEAAQAAKMTYQTLYFPAVIDSVANRLVSAQALFQGGGGVPARNIGSLLDVRFTGSGVTFDVRKQSAMEKFEIYTQTKLVKELNSITAGINQLIRIGAHMEGHTDYAKYWEENKEYWLSEWGLISKETGESTTQPVKQPPRYSKEPDTTGHVPLIPTEKKLKEMAQFTPAEKAKIDAYMKSPEYIAELRDEIKRATHPVAKKALEEALASALRK